MYALELLLLLNSFLTTRLRRYR